ncbi:MAG TPA: zf-HC2 domain-containing protein [Gemmatimonadales bacterium]|nr:zf-HC2 domain-containing protein [Gemmatimonadales bacterium]
MPHVDEGTLHALLDGELDPASITEIRTHFNTCPACLARLEEARELLAETERLVSALELPAAGAAQRGGGGGATVVMPPPLGTPSVPLDPVVLIPENPTPREVRRGRLRAFAWAAGLFVAVGAGVVGVQTIRIGSPARDRPLRISPDEFRTGPVPAAAPAAELRSLDSAMVAGAETVAAAQRRAVAPATPATPEPRPAETKPAPAGAGALEKTPALAKAPAPTAAPARALAAAPAPAPAEPKSAEPNREQVDRAQSARATFELDRRLNRQRAAEATAALDDRKGGELEARERQEAQAAAGRAAPPVPTLDQRAQITQRIGLDEASRQLGGPLHAIDGMARQLVGLVPGGTVPGTDPSRPVVRAVYVERASGKLVFLDQQIAAAGERSSSPQGGPGGSQRWVRDGVLLVLHGELGPDSLRSLTARVR